VGGVNSSAGTTVGVSPGLVATGMPGTATSATGVGSSSTAVVIGGTSAGNSSIGTKSGNVTSSTAGNVGGPLGLLNATLLSVVLQESGDCACRQVEKPSTGASRASSATGGSSGAGMASSMGSAMAQLVNSVSSATAGQVATHGGLSSSPSSTSSSVRAGGTIGGTKPILKRLSRRFGVGRDSSAESKTTASARRDTMITGDAIVANEADSAIDPSVLSCALLVYNVPDSIRIVTIHSERSRDITDAFIPIKVKGRVTTHELTRRTDGPVSLRLLVGLSCGEILFFSEIAVPQVSGKLGYSGPIIFNKEGTGNSNPVILLKWVPQNSNRFIAVQADGTVSTYDLRYRTPSRGRADGTSMDETSVESIGTDAGHANVDQTPSVVSFANGKHFGGGSGGEARKPPQTVVPPPPGLNEVSSWKRHKKANPLVVLQIGVGSQGVTSAALESSKMENLALAGGDGYLRVLSLVTEKLSVVFRSYFAGFLSVSWSPDGRLLAAGGQDDLVSIFSPIDRCLLGRFEGHTSWVSDISWDPIYYSRQRYRLGSAGQDCRTLFWEVGHSELFSRRRSGSRGGSTDMNDISSDQMIDSGSLVVENPPHTRVKRFEPVASFQSHDEPLTSIEFVESCVVSGSAGGSIRVWEKLEPVRPSGFRSDSISTDCS